MRQDFDNNMTMAEKISRVHGAKKVGRKHQKRISHSTKNNIQSRKTKHKQLVNNEKTTVFRKKVKEYWAGLIDEYPG